MQVEAALPIIPRPAVPASAAVARLPRARPIAAQASRAADATAIPAPCAGAEMVWNAPSIP
ncbi:hypothetical protein I553_2382 [Mycobacterium xenopi 4042]|uniref:Uncharacterized protein n=1 Tax=Mycobacterium xenopi 4042 TaxID=1299334 RepID=X8C8S0_MYCXE|nr:hypothetical protein I553_2382 [Mycobacterium xenopi 4042]